MAALEDAGETETELPPLPGPHGIDTVAQHTMGAVGVNAPQAPVPSPSTSRAVLERSPNGGGVCTVVVLIAAGSSVPVSAVSAGTIQCRVTAVDAAGNASTPVSTAVVSPRLIQLVNTAVKCTSTWYAWTSASLYGKTLKWSQTRYATAPLTTTARSVAIAVYRGTGRGKAYIYVGTTIVVIVGLYRSAGQARYVIWAKDWGVSATRVIKAQVLATSGCPWVDLDGSLSCARPRSRAMQGGAGLWHARGSAEGQVAWVGSGSVVEAVRE